MGTACSRPSPLSPTRKAQQFVASIHADSCLPDPTPDTPQDDDHVARVLFPAHPNPQCSTVPATQDCPEAVSQPDTVLLELYTSQGCQSCPTADALLSELSDTSQEVANAHIITLAFHTTVWDHRGHADPFAQQAFRLRHRAYAEVLEPLQSAYTPQLVVQGQQHLVGGSRVSVVRCVEHQAARLRRAAKTKQCCTLSLRLQRVGQLRVQVVVAFDVPPPPPLRPARQRRRSSSSEDGPDDAEQPVTAGERAVMVALVEDARLTKILKGDNRGATLRNDRIVRGAWCLDASVGEGARGRVGAVLDVPEDVLGRLSVVAWLQQVYSLRVDAVVQARVV